jgi:hypothetical protein
MLAQPAGFFYSNTLIRSALGLLLSLEDVLRGFLTPAHNASNGSSTSELTQKLAGIPSDFKSNHFPEKERTLPVFEA